MNNQDGFLLRMLIRDVTIEDQGAAQELVLSGLGEHFGRIDPSLNPDLDDIFTAYPASGNRFIVALIDGEIVATGGLLIESKEAGRIVRLSVKREFRGHGIGKTIILHLVQIARECRLLRINVETNLDWHPAIGLYKRCGFRKRYSDDESVHMAIDIA